MVILLNVYLKPAEDNVVNVEESLKAHYELAFSWITLYEVYLTRLSIEL